MTADTSTREALRAAVADYLLENGLADLSLRPLASATGTSARMLVYHFGSKERLIAEAMAEIRARQQKLVETWIRRHPTASFGDFLPVAWAWVSDRRHQPYLRLFLEVLGRGLRRRDHFAEFARSTFEEWVSFVQRRLEEAGRPREASRALAILMVSTIRGLALYHVATRDDRGASRALRVFSRLSARETRRRR